MPKDIKIESDVLVVGGGMSGIFAAIKARQAGASVTLVDKGYAGKSGQTPYAKEIRVITPEWGDDIGSWVDQFSKLGEYINNRTWTELILRKSYDRYQDLVSWGVQFRKDEDIYAPVVMEWKVFGDVLRKKLLEQGVRVIDRCMITDLFQQEGRITGALGIPMGEYDRYIFQAKATVLCSGASGFKSWGWPISSLTSDGEIMAYRAGATLTGKEFCDTKFIPTSAPAYFGFSNWLAGGPEHLVAKIGGRSRMIDAEGQEIEERSESRYFMLLEFAVNKGRAPIYIELPGGKKIEIVAGTTTGMAHHKGEGIWPSGTDCSTGVSGLYAAGDILGDMPLGALYCAGMGIASATVTGAIAGNSAAEYALSTEATKADDGEVRKAKKDLQNITERKGGFSPRWVTQLLQNTLMPYFVLMIKSEDRMKAALTNIEYYRDHLVPMLYARDPHELRLAIETRNMVLNAEMKLKAALFRTESRGLHYREDYPRRDDNNWLAWVLIEDNDGEMKVFKKPVPKEWWPDPNLSYSERYPARFPGE
jgi:succinate dehydrogenase/fumarate reductase flavoprotein subunit